MLGQTLPCPKCKGPIAVPAISPANKTAARPAPTTGPRASAPIVDSTAMTKVGDFDWNEILPNEDVSSRSEHQGDSGLRFKSANEPDFIPIPSTLNPITPMVASAADRPIHRQAWQSNALAKRRQWLTLATIAISGSLCAIGGFVVFLQMVGSKSKPIAETPTVASSLPAIDKPDSNALKELDLNSSSEATPATQDDNHPLIEMSQEKTLPPFDAPTLPNLDSASGGKPLVAGAPLDDDSQLSAFDSPLPWILGGNNTLGEILTTNNDSTELIIEEADVYQEMEIHPKPHPIPSWDKSDKMVLAAVKDRNTSLLRCIDLFGRLSGIGITVDWQSCRVAGIDITQKIEIDAENKSVAAIVEEIVQSQGLEWTLGDLRLPVISAPKKRMDLKMQIDWSIVGLFPEGAEQAGCGTLIKLWGCDDVCSFSEGQLKWTEQATAIEKANMQASLAELASVRKLDDANPWYKTPESGRIFSTSQWNKSSTAFERRIRPTVHAPERRPIPDLLMTAAAETNLNLVIDWQNAWRHGLTPNELAAIVLAGRTFPQVAKRFLTDFALELVPISDDTVWLTTREVRRKLIRVVPVRLPKNFKVDDLRQSLRLLGPVVDELSKFKVVPIPGTEDLFFARICSPNASQLSDPDVMLGLGWPDRR